MLRKHFFMIIFFFSMPLRSMELTELVLPQDIIEKQMMPLLDFQDVARLQQTRKSHKYFDPEKVCQSPEGCASTCPTHACRNLVGKFDACTKALVHFAKNNNDKMFTHLYVYAQQTRDDIVLKWFEIEKQGIRPIDRIDMYRGNCHTKKELCVMRLEKLETALKNRDVATAKIILSTHQFDPIIYRINTKQNFLLPIVGPLGNITIFLLLLGKNYPVNKTDPLQKSVLHHVAEHGTSEMMTKLIEMGGNINAADSNGCTSLHYASRRKGNGAMVRLLLDNGADYNAVDKNGKPALDF